MLNGNMLMVFVPAEEHKNTLFLNITALWLFFSSTLHLFYH